MGDDKREIWIRSSLLPNGHYVATLELSDDDAVALTTEAAATYALAVLDAVQAAEYDAAVRSQLVDKLGLGEKLAAEFIGNELRPRRSGLRQTGTKLSLTPGVAAGAGHPFLAVAIDGVPVGQWDIASARAHALGVLEVSLCARYDTAYRTALIEDIGIEPDRAENVIEDIANHRPGSS